MEACLYDTRGYRRDRLYQQRSISNCFRRAKQNAELHALSSRNYAHMEEIKNTYHLTDATLFSDYNAMLASSGIDMVIVCTPHFCHPDMAIRSIERGSILC